MNSKLKLTLKSIAHSGAHIGRDITLKVSSSQLGINFETKKNVLPDKTTVLNIELYNLEVEISKLDIPLTVTVIERDALFNDKGSMHKRLYITTNTSPISEHIITVKVYENRLFFWKKPAKFDVVFEVEVEKNEIPNGHLLHQYNNVGNFDYNKLDSLILKSVEYWNNEFANDLNPPDKLLDPNLVKAMLYQESQVGNDSRNNGLVNVMQVGNKGDPSLLVLRKKYHKNESWVKNGELVDLHYPDASNDSPENSILWGTRWLYHKAQINVQNNDGSWHSKWNSWKEAVDSYGPGDPEYIKNIWSIYQKGIDTRDGVIKLWSFVGLLVAAIFSAFGWFGITDENIRQSFATHFDFRSAVYREGIDVLRDENSPFVLAYESDDENWSEWVGLGFIDANKIEWLDDHDLNNQLANGILSAQFIKLEGFTESILEVFDTTHMGNGSIHLYSFNQNTKQIRPLFQACAVDNYHDTRQDPKGYPELGGGWWGSCSVYYKDGRLEAKYKDVNSDGVDDVVLTGTQQIFCSRTYDEEEQLVQEKEIYEEYILRPDQYQNPKQCISLNNFF